MDQQISEFQQGSPEALYVPTIELTEELLEKIEAAPRGTSETFGATPFDMLYALSLQEAVLEKKMELLEAEPKSTPQPIKEYVRRTFVKRFRQRLEANDENLMTSLLFRDKEKAAVDDRILPMIDRGRSGGASPAELMLLRNHLGTRSLEVACLSHPFGEEIENLSPMRDAVKKGVEALGGQYDDDPAPCYGVKEFVYDDDGNVVGVLMTRKFDVGQLPDGTTVRERSSFVLRLDQDSAFRKSAGLPAVVEMTRIAQMTKDAQKEALVPFNDLITSLFKDDTFTEVVPISTTVYAFNKEVEEQLKNMNVTPQYGKYKPAGAIPVDAELQDRLYGASDSFNHPVYKVQSVDPDTSDTTSF